LCMVPKLEDIIALLERIAPASTAEDWDNPGLQVGDPSQEIRRVLMTLDPTIKAVQEARNRDATLVLSHHPLIFPSLSSLNRELPPGDVIYEACRSGIAIVSAHTNLDIAQGGINDMLASLFRLTGAEALKKSEGAAGTGLGRIGDLQESAPLPHFTERIKNLLGLEFVRMSGGGKERIKRVAVVGGSGGSLVSLAFAMGADVLVTGDVGHHDALRAERLGMALIDAGHFHTEKKAFALFGDRLRDLLIGGGWDVEVENWQEERNPLNWG
jgi:dinuclear metal center YbgI/SA1388 family protein